MFLQVNLRNLNCRKPPLVGPYCRTATRDKIFENSSSFHIIWHYGKSSISIFKESFANIDIFGGREEDWALGYNSMKL